MLFYGPLITNKMAIFLWPKERGSEMQLRKNKLNLRGVETKESNEKQGRGLSAEC